ncbi:MAG: ABC transporter permease [Actinomycetota bacterium]
MSDAAVSAPPGRSSAEVVAWLRARGVYVALGLLILFNLAFTKHFATTGTLKLNLIQVTPIVIVSLGMAMVIGTAGIDLSVGSVMALSSALVPIYLRGYNPWVSVIMCIIAGAVVGLINGVMIAIVGIQPIVATLGTLVAVHGMALVFAHGKLTEFFNSFYNTVGSGNIGPSFARVSVRILTMLVLIAVVGVIVRRSTFGRRLVAVGGNRQASVLAGLPVRSTIITVYMLCSILAAVAGVLETARSGAGNPGKLGNLMELSAITAVVVGGTPLTGGRVKILGTCFAALFLLLLGATLIRQNVPQPATLMIQAVIIVAAVFFQRERGTR